MQGPRVCLNCSAQELEEFEEGDVDRGLDPVGRVVAGGAEGQQEMCRCRDGWQSFAEPRAR
jgi:hypothetical protein